MLRVHILTVRQKADAHLIATDNQKCISVRVPLYVLSRERCYTRQINFLKVSTN